MRRGSADAWSRRSLGGLGRSPIFN